jgi:hypothetical protein
VNADRRARKKESRVAAGRTHEHLKGLRCTICKPLPAGALTDLPHFPDEAARITTWRGPARSLLGGRRGGRRAR